VQSARASELLQLRLIEWIDAALPMPDAPVMLTLSTNWRPSARSFADTV
jgi:hypothetical protein